MCVYACLLYVCMHVCMPVFVCVCVCIYRRGVCIAVCLPAWLPVMSCPVLSFPLLSRPILPCPVLCCPVLPCISAYMMHLDFAIEASGFRTLDSGLRNWAGSHGAFDDKRHMKHCNCISILSLQSDISKARGPTMFPQIVLMF